METCHFKSEDQMQADIVKKFNEKYPHLYGCLFKVNNESRNPMFQIATGLIPGASDLVLFCNHRFAGIELKLKGKKHSKEHIATQKEWGETIKKQGGYYLMSDDVNEILSFIDKIVN